MSIQIDSPRTAGLLASVTGTVILVLALALGGCGESETQNPAPKDWIGTPVMSLDTPSGMWDTHVFIDDVQGDRSLEVVVADTSGHLQIFSATGRLMVDTTLRIKGAVPSLIHDIDGDGRGDLVYGTSDAMAPRVIIVNGRGAITGEYVVSEVGKSYRSVTPVVADDSALYATTMGIWASSPRGILAIDTDSLTEIWEYRFPSIPTGLVLQKDDSGASLLTISHKTEPLGEFAFLGPDPEPQYGIDAAILLAGMDQNGETAYGSHLYRAGRRLIATAEFSALGSRIGDLLLLETQIESNPDDLELPLSKRQLSVVSTVSQSIISVLALSDDSIYTAIADLDGGMVVVVNPDGQGSRIRLLNSHLELKTQTRTNLQIHALGPVLTTGPDNRFQLLTATSRGVGILDEELSFTPLIDGIRAEKMALGASRNETLVALVGESVRVFRLDPQ